MASRDILEELLSLRLLSEGQPGALPPMESGTLPPMAQGSLPPMDMAGLPPIDLSTLASDVAVPGVGMGAGGVPFSPSAPLPAPASEMGPFLEEQAMADVGAAFRMGAEGLAGAGEWITERMAPSIASDPAALAKFDAALRFSEPALPAWARSDLMVPIESEEIATRRREHKKAPSAWTAAAGKGAVEAENYRRQEQLLGPNPYRYAEGSGWKVDIPDPATTIDPGDILSSGGSYGKKEDPGLLAFARAAGARDRDWGLLHPAISAVAWEGATTAGGLPSALRFMADIQHAKGKAYGLDFQKLVDIAGVTMTSDGGEERSLIGYGNSYALMRLGDLAKNDKAALEMLQLPEVQQYLSEHSGDALDTPTSAARGQVNSDLGELADVLEPYLVSSWKGGSPADPRPEELRDAEGKMLSPREAALASGGRPIGSDLFKKTTSYLDDPEGVEYEINNAPLELLPTIVAHALNRGDGMTATVAQKRYSAEFVPRNLSFGEVVGNIDRSSGLLMLGLINMTGLPVIGQSLAAHVTAAGQESETFRKIWNAVAPQSAEIQDIPGQSGYDTEVRYLGDVETGVGHVIEGVKELPSNFHLLAHKASFGLIPIDPETARKASRYYQEMPIMAIIDALVIAPPITKLFGGLRGLYVHRAMGLERALLTGVADGSALYRNIATIDGMMGRLYRGAKAKRTAKRAALVEKYQEGLRKGDPRITELARKRLAKWDPALLDGLAADLVKKLDETKAAVEADPAAAGASVAGLSKAEIIDKLIQHVRDIKELDHGYATAVGALGYLAEGTIGGKWTQRLWNMMNKPSTFVDSSTRALADTLKGKMPGEIRDHLAKIEQTRHALDEFGWGGEDTTRAAMMMAAGEGDVGALAQLTAGQGMSKAQTAELARFRAELQWTPSKAFVEAVNEAAAGPSRSAGAVAFDMVRADIKRKILAGEVYPPQLRVEVPSSPLGRYGTKMKPPRGVEPIELPSQKGAPKPTAVSDAVLDATSLDIAMEALGVRGPRPGVNEFARIYDGIEQSSMLRSLETEAKRQVALYTMGRLQPRLARNEALMGKTIKYKNSRTGKVTETPASAVVDALEDVVTDIGSLSYDTGLAAVDAELIGVEALRAHGLQYVHNVVNQWGMKNIKGKINTLLKDARRNSDPHSIAMLEDLQRQLDIKRSKVPAVEQEWARLAMEGPEFIAATYGASKPQALKQRMILDTFKYGADSASPLTAGAVGREAHRYMRKGGPLAMEEMYRQIFHVRILAKTIQHMGGWADDVAGVVRDMTHSPIISASTTKFLQERMGIDGSKLPTSPGARTIEISRILDEAKAVSVAALPTGTLEMLKARGWKPASAALKEIAPAKVKMLAKYGQDVLIHPDQVAFWKYLERTKKQPMTWIGKGETWLVRQFKQRKIVFETAPWVRDEFSNVWINGPRGGLYPYSDSWLLASKIIQTESAFHRRFREMGLLDSGLSMEIGAGVSDLGYGIRNRLLRSMDDHHAGNPLDVTGLMARAVDIRNKAVRGAKGTLSELGGLIVNPGATRIGGWLTYERNLVDFRARVAQATLDTVKAALEEGLVNPEIAARLDVLGRRIGVKGRSPSGSGHEAWVSAINRHVTRGAGKAGRQAKAATKTEARKTPLLKRDIAKPGFEGRQAKGEHIGRRLDDVAGEILAMVPEERMVTIVDKARKQFADYADTPAWVDHLSKHIYGVPFIKYSAQMIPRSVSHFLNNPLLAEAYMQMSQAANTIAWNVVGGEGRWRDAYQEYQNPWQLLLPMFPGVPWATSVSELEKVRDTGGVDMTWLTPVGGAAGVVNPLQSPLVQTLWPLAQMATGENPRATFPMDFSGVGHGKLPEPAGHQLTTPGAPLPQRIKELGGGLAMQLLGHGFVPPGLVPGPGVTGTTVSPTHRPAVEALFGVDSPNKLRGPAALMMLRSLGVKASPFGERATTARRAQSRLYTQQRAEERKQMGMSAHRRNYFDAARDASGEESLYEIGKVASRVEVGGKRRKQGLVSGEGMDTFRDAELVGNARTQYEATSKRLKEIGEALIDNMIRRLQDPGDAKMFFEMTPMKQREFFLAVQYDVADRRAKNTRRILRGEESLGTEWEIAPAGKVLGMDLAPEGPDPAALRDEPVRPDYLEAAGDKGYLDWTPGEFGEPSQGQRYQERVEKHEERVKKKKGALAVLPERLIGHPEKIEADVLLSPEEQAKEYERRKKKIMDEQKKRAAEIKRWTR